MRTIASSFRCVQRWRDHHDDLTRWAADLVAHPERYGADERACDIVAKLLARVMAQ